MWISWLGVKNPSIFINIIYIYIYIENHILIYIFLLNVRKYHILNHVTNIFYVHIYRVIFLIKLFIYIYMNVQIMCKIPMNV